MDATQKKEEDKWKVEGDVRALKESEIIKADPDRMKKAMAMMDEEMQAMMKIHAQRSMEDDARKRFSKTYPKKETHEK